MPAKEELEFQRRHMNARPQGVFLQPDYAIEHFEVDGLVTKCRLVLPDGTEIESQTKADSKKQFTAEIGQQIARDKALRQAVG